jgi:hypothetical protein
MKKLLLFTITMIAQLAAMAQWISVPTMFAPFNGRIVSIDVGSSTQVMATAVHTNGSGYQCAYKYNFVTSLWDMYQDGQGLNVNFSNAAIASDGTIWTAAGSKSYKNSVVKTNPFTAVSARSNSVAVGCTGVFAGENVYLSNSPADVFNLMSTSLKYDKVDVAEDGTMCALYTYLGSTYITRYDNVLNGWTPLLSYYSDVAVGDANKVLAVQGGQLFYYHVASSTWIRDITAPANVTSISLASDGTAYLLTSATSNNVYKSTWAKITCGVDDLATNTTPVSQQTICITANTTTLTASATGTVSWFANTTTLTPIATGTALTTNTLAIGSYTYYAANTLTCGTSPRTPIVVTVEGAPGLSVGSTPLANRNICAGSTTTLLASASAGSTLAWYDAPTGGNLLGTGATYITPTLSNTTSFYVNATSVGGCVSTRTLAVSVYKSPNDISNAGAQSICFGQNTVISANTSPGSISWYNAATGGTLLASALSLNTGTLATTTTFYAENNNAYCIPPRTPFTVTVTPIPSAPLNTTPAGNQSVCYPNTTTTLSASGVGTLNWYASATGGTVLATGTTFTNPGIVFTTTYYVADNLGSCISPSRTAVTVTVTSVSSPAFTGSASISICSGNTASLTATSPGPISWFASPTGTTALTTGTVYTTPTLTSNTSYYISTTSNGCESPRAVKTVTVKPIPAAPIDMTVSQGGSLNICSGQSTTIYTDNYDNWFTVPIGGSMIAGGSQYSTPSLTTNTTYYAEYNLNGCPSLRTAITVTVSACTGIKEAQELNSISLQPNPASTFFTLNNVAEGTLVSVFDVTGKVVISNSNIDGSKTMTIETDNLPNGIYVIQLKNNGAVAHKKLIVSK